MQEEGKSLQHPILHLKMPLADREFQPELLT